jgi:DNA repair protein RecO (recombination protein O)
MKKIVNEPAFVLHRYDWSESSLILEVFTRHHGRIALVAKGVKRPSSQFRPILLPLQPLHIAFGGDAEVRTLKAAEWMGGLTMPSGDVLMSGYYINELILKLLARDDPHESLFDAYAQVTQLLRDSTLADGALRAFELLVLRDIGLLPSLDMTSATLQPLQTQAAYTLLPEAGLRIVPEGRAANSAANGAAKGASNSATGDAADYASERPSLAARHWLALQTALDANASSTTPPIAPLTALRAVCASMTPAERNALKNVLRSLLHYHSGGKTLRTRQMMMDVQAL